MGGDTYPVPDDTWLTVVPGYNTICGVNTAGTLSCWDQDTAEISTTLLPPSDRGPYQDVCLAGEWGWGCALDKDGHAECFGDYDTTHYPWDVPIPDVAFASLSCGANHACGLTTDGQVRCFGNNSYGQANAPAL